MGFTKSGTDLFGLIEGFHAQQPIAGLMVRLHPFFNWLRATGLAEKFLLPKPTDKTGYGRLMAGRLSSCSKILRSTNKGGYRQETRSWLNSRLCQRRSVVISGIRDERS